MWFLAFLMAFFLENEITWLDRLIAFLVLAFAIAGIWQVGQMIYWLCTHIKIGIV